MEIKVDKIKKTVKFEEIKRGDIFSYNDNIYIATYPIEETNVFINATSLYSGELTYFNKDTIVKLVDYDFKVIVF